MKKQWLPFVVAALLSAPIASADEGSIFPSFEQILGQIVALFAGDEAKIDQHFSPTGQPVFTTTGGVDTGDEQEIGENYPPHG